LKNALVPQQMRVNMQNVFAVHSGEHLQKKKIKANLILRAASVKANPGKKSAERK